MAIGDMVDDPELSGAVDRILSRGPEALGDGPLKQDVRENRVDREPHEEQNDGDMDLRDSEEPDADQPQDIEPDGDSFLELPGEEGQEPERIPLSEAAEAIKAYRQMNGDIASAVIKAESEAEAKQGELLQTSLQKLQQTEALAQTALKVLERIMPALPSEELLNPNSEYFDPQGYYAAKARYDQAVAFAGEVYTMANVAGQGKQQVLSEGERASIERENSRLARYIPEWGKDDTREAKRTEIINALNAKYGVTAEDMVGVVNHKAWRMMADLVGTLKTDRKAPEVRKAVQEKAAKLVNGRLPPVSRDPSGRFVNEARKAHKQGGNEDTFAALLMKSGRLKDL